MSFCTRPEDFLGPIFDEALVPLEVGATINRDALLSHATDQRAAVRSFKVIGEATKRLDDILRQEHPGLPRRDWPGRGTA